MLNELVALLEKYESELTLAQARVDVAKEMIATLEQKYYVADETAEETETNEQPNYEMEV